jgi:hypothetical protein
MSEKIEITACQIWWAVWMWSAVKLILFKDILDRLGRLRPGIVGTNDELASACLESEVENAPQNNIGIVRSIELLSLWKREHDGKFAILTHIVTMAFWSSGVWFGLAGVLRQA